MKVIMQDDRVSK